MAIRDPAAPKSDRPANIEHVLHDFGVLYLQGKARAGPARSGGPLIQNDTLFDCIGDVLEALSSVSAVFPICKVAFVLLQAVQKALKEIRSVDEDIRSLFRALYETVRKAAACCGRNPIPGIAADLQRIGRVAGSSAETVDKWIHEKALKRVFHAGHVHDQLRHCMQELENVQDDIQFNVELALCQTAAWNLPLGANVAPTSPRPAHPFAQTESPRPRSSNRVEVAMRNETPAHRTLSGPRSYTRSDSGRSHTSRGHLTYPDSPPSAAFSSRRKAYATQDYGEHTFNPDQSSLTLPIVLPHTPESYSTPLPSEPEWENDHRTSTEEEFYYSGEDEDEEEHPLPHAINLPLNSYAHADDGYKAYTDSPIPRYRVTN
ncbi:hypothetical protein BDW22DRAFT_1206329 [Trametopsis cervina]|nr:hypothetical protein BDW22DRAFT_1206329 [Trametopsis cervina]